MSEVPVSAPGWDAIDRWVGAHFRGPTPHQFTSRTPYELDKPSPLPAITVWSTKAPPGWLYVSYGLSELFEKTTGDPNISGFGFELSFRLPAAPEGPSRGSEPEQGHPPIWPLRLLQSIGHHVLTTRRGFDSGDAIDLGHPLVQPGSDGPSECRLTGLLCLPDPQLGKIETPHGSLLFLRLFGVTAEELAATKQLELASVVACMAELEPMLVTDPLRGSFADDPEKSKILRRYKLGIALG
jgi:hypothetical protein